MLNVSSLHRSVRLALLTSLLASVSLLASCAAPTPAAPTAAPAATAAAETSATIAPAATAAAEASPTTAPTATPAATEAATPAPSGEALTVFAAASLQDAFGQIGKDFETANPGAHVAFNFAGSQQLAQQLGQGAPADVFASANNTQMNVAVTAGRIISGTPRTFVRNRLVVVVPSGNPAKLQTLQDLGKPGVKLVLAAKEVPVGQYALDFLGKASAQPEFGETYSQTVLANVVSYEDNVKAVLTKVALGEADAGIVYSTDVTPDVKDKVTKITIPDALNTVASYPIAAVQDSKQADLANKFVAYVLSDDGQKVLALNGFIPTNGAGPDGTRPKGPLAVSGLVSKPASLAVDDLKKLDQLTVTVTDRDGKEQTYTGVSIAKLLEDAGISADAKAVDFVGADGYVATVPITDVQADKDAIIAILDEGSLRNILPAQMPRAWVRGLTTLEVK
jgi:molybdate transport system substrate-binding protein